MPTSVDHDRLVHMLKESILLMCKNSLSFDVELRVEGFLGITVDRRGIFLVNINEVFQSETQSVGEKSEFERAYDGVPERHRMGKKRRQSDNDPSSAWSPSRRKKRSHRRQSQGTY